MLWSAQELKALARVAQGVRQSVKSPSCIGLRSTALVLIALKNIKNGGFLFSPPQAAH